MGVPFFMTPEEMSTYNQRLAAFALDFVHAGNLPRINEASQLGQDVGGPRIRGKGRVTDGVSGSRPRGWPGGETSNFPKRLKQMTR